ncbi:hypothetical protein GCM10010271_38590 [Streptomyces kurssanovii]|nr:hypothetical protein GCM10010271_38590 [Streptomyces kurssanovii]
MLIADPRQLLVELRAAPRRTLERRHRRQEVGYPPVTAEGDGHQQGGDRIGGQPLLEGGPVTLQPPALGRMRGRVLLQDRQARRRLAEGGHVEPAARERIRVDLPPAQWFRLPAKH